MHDRSNSNRSTQRRDRLIREPEHDPYKVQQKLPDPTACPTCGACYHKGRWTWSQAPVDAHSEACPACRRIRDEYPAGFATLVGAFPLEHRLEVLGLVRNLEERQRNEHPMKRIMDIREDSDAIHITTTDAGLARNIGDALEGAYQGELEYQYSSAEGPLRVTWRR